MNIKTRAKNLIWEEVMELDMEQLMDYALELEEIVNELKTAYFSRELTEKEAYEAEANQGEQSEEIKDMLRRLEG